MSRDVPTLLKLGPGPVEIEFGGGEHLDHQKLSLKELDYHFK